MSDLSKLNALYQRLVAEQHRLVTAAAGQQVMPTESMLRQIADIESTLTAVATMIEDARQNGQRT